MKALSSGGSRWWGAVRAGAEAGILGTAVMSLAMYGLQRLGLLGRMPPRTIVRRLLGKPRFSRPLPMERALSALAHLGFGATQGVVFALAHAASNGLSLKPSAPPTAKSGVPFGLMVWAANYCGLLPATGLFAPPSRDRPGRPTSMALSHVVYGWVLGEVLGRRVAHWNGRRSPERVLILGGSRGLGLLLAKEYLRRGHRVIIAARDEVRLSLSVDVLRNSSPAADVSAVRCDVENEGELRDAISAAQRRLGGIDVLVNNAGKIQVGPLAAMTLDDFDRALRVHLRAPLIASLAVIEEMRARRFGRIVNISSIGGMVPVPHLLPYVVSKFALTGLSEGLRVELAQDGISVTTVCPGLMRTGSTSHATFKAQHRLEHAWFALSAATPLTSMSARRAARKIVDAAERGDSILVLSWQAKLLAALHALAPNLVLGALSTVNRLLPNFGGIGSGAREGRHSASRWAPSWVTTLNDRAARELGEVPGRS